MVLNSEFVNSQTEKKEKNGISTENLNTQDPLRQMRKLKQKKIK